MPDVEVGLGAVVGDEDLAVLERVHRPGVDVEVRVELLHRHAQAAGRSSWPRLEAVRPLPSEEATPPVTKMCLVVAVRPRGAPVGSKCQLSVGESSACPRASRLSVLRAPVSATTREGPPTRRSRRRRRPCRRPPARPARAPGRPGRPRCPPSPPTTPRPGAAADPADRRRRRARADEDGAGAARVQRAEQRGDGRFGRLLLPRPDDDHGQLGQPPRLAVELHRTELVEPGDHLGAVLVRLGAGLGGDGRPGPARCRPARSPSTPERTDVRRHQPQHQVLQRGGRLAGSRYVEVILSSPVRLAPAPSRAARVRRTSSSVALRAYAPGGRCAPPACRRSSAAHGSDDADVGAGPAVRGQ